MVWLNAKKYKGVCMFANVDLYNLLEEKFIQYNQPAFIETDPIQIPRMFSKKENIEIAGFLAAIIAWGQRPVIIKNARRLMELMGNDPYSFLMETKEDDWGNLLGFTHRTFNTIDLMFFMRSLRNIYQNHGGLEAVFYEGFLIDETVSSALRHFREVFFDVDHLSRSEKHVSNVVKRSSAKRLNMFLRWMVRCDEHGVDFGIWKGISPSKLMIPLDVHTGNVSRALGLLSRTQDDWLAVEELTQRLREFDPVDPVKYDFALFGIGVFESR